MTASILDVLSNLTLGETQRFANVAVTPLYSETAENVAYTGLSRALASSAFKITEVSESGSVPDLRLVSELDEAVLLIDGEELRGAKQNRILNATILAEAHSQLTIPVSCTEHGRWSYLSDRFADSDVVMTPRHRAATSADVHQSLREGRSYRSDQGAVWSRVGAMHDKLGTRSATGAMRDAFEAGLPRLERFAEAFPCTSRQKGLAVAVDGRLLGLELISRSEVYADLHPKLIRSYAMETLLQTDGSQVSDAGNGGVSVLLEQLAAASETRNKSVGLGWDIRYAGSGVVGSALVVDEDPVHMAFFRLDAGSASAGAEEIAGFSRRARFRTQQMDADDQSN